MNLDEAKAMIRRHVSYLSDGHNNPLLVDAASIVLHQLERAERELNEQTWRFCPDCGCEVNGGDLLADPTGGR